MQNKSEPIPFPSEVHKHPGIKRGPILNIFEEDKRGTAIEFVIGQKRREIEKMLLIIEAGANSDDPEESGSMGSLGRIATYNIQMLEDIIEAGSDLELELKANSEGIAAIRKLSAKMLATVLIGFSPKRTSFLERIGAMPNEDDVRKEKFGSGFKTKTEKEDEEDEIKRVSAGLIDTIYRNSEEGQLVASDIKQIVEMTMKVSKKDKTVSKEWIVTSAEQAILRRPECEKDILEILSLIYYHYEIPDYEEIENDIIERLGRLTERKARSKAREEVYIRFCEIGMCEGNEEIVMEYMLQTYKYNFEGKNKNMGDEFGHVYIQEITKELDYYNKSVLNAKDGRKEIDIFFPRRLIAYFKRKGVDLKTAN